MLENYHPHTTRCRHASGTEEEYVLQAISKGLKVLGFSDHAPFRFPGIYYSTMRMYPEELKDYTASIKHLKEKYSDKIDIRIGLEAEYYPERISSLLELMEPLDVEYLILGQHWCGNEQGEPHNGAPTDDEKRLARYCDQVAEALHTGLFSYFAHPDIMLFTGNETIYRTHTIRLCQTAKDLHIPLEINFLGLREGRPYPRPLFWEIAGEVGCQAVFGSDAHHPEHVYDPNSEIIALDMVKKYGLTLLEHVPIHSWKDGKLLK